MAYRLINVQEVISTAYTVLDTEESRFEILFENWAWDALREIGPTLVDKARKCLPVVDRCFEKPKDFCYAIDLNLLDDNNCIHYFQYAESGWLASEAHHPHQAFDGLWELGFYRNSPIQVAETRTHFELSFQADCEHISKAELLYYSLPVDEDGNMLIEENLKDAIISYIEYCYYKTIRNRTRLPGKTNLVPMSEIDWYYTKWVRLKSQKKAEARMPDPLAMDTITRKWTTMIPNFQNKYRHKLRGNLFNRRFY